MKRFLSLIMMLWGGSVSAKSFGVVGEVFPVAEKSFLVLIYERLQALTASGELDALNQRWVQTVAFHANRPTALGLKRTDRSITHDYYPEVTLSADILDDRGRLLYAKGTQINALERLPAYQPCWLFFNSEDEAQLHWAAQQKVTCNNPKFILTGGSVQAAEQKLQAVIYFDQAGRITTKLAILHVPALVKRAGNRLTVVEQAIKENGDVL
ncbi:Type-F conjugative transfer system protein [Legionella beliardensis]|uniref:Type-F conjugative transfer system protein n=1 Tax=Legionella beliardensis TaxID=91822 RepID=A0A378JTU6_9GAMM|nr:type-F conjugative transfer system protein TraW [Legionella beliardensis]STX55690.1 Type-F conjugative transfer system protein [Legionella beliardensis]